MNRFNGLNILVADDNKLNNQSIKQLLEFSGATVSVAENGYQALESIRNAKKPFHLVLMDIQMPKLDGRETTRIIRQDKKFSDIPIIAVTADNSLRDQFKCFQSGMDGFIAKPLDYDTLCTCIANVLENKDNQSFTVIDNSDDVDELVEVESEHEILQRFANNADLVVQMISLYQLESEKLLTVIKQNQQQTKMRETLHALKGLASTIGAKQVVHRIQNLSDVLKSSRLDREAISQAKEQLLQAQIDGVKQLKCIFGIGEATDEAQSRQASSDCLTSQQKQNLIVLLEAKDLSVITQVDEIKKQHPENSFVLKLSNLINQLKFKQAISLLSLDKVSNP